MRKILVVFVCSMSGLIVAAGMAPLLRAARLASGKARLTLEFAPNQDASSTAQAKSKRRLFQEIQLTGDQLWVDTGMDVRAGEHVIVHATGTLQYADAKEKNGPDGIPRGFKDLLRILPLNAAGLGALIGRVGEADIAQAFLLGSQGNVVVPVGGRFFVGINQTSEDTGDGAYKVEIEVDAPDAGANYEALREVKSISGIDAQLFSKIPRRVADSAGNPGDMVNFLIIGSESAMQHAFTNAGWVKVDADVRDTVLHGLEVTLSKGSYLTMPMSRLYLFGRPQDYGWAHAEPIRVVASRNHLRIWKAPVQVQDRTLWIGAATHDIGFERDERNDKLTHKIDPDVDLERDYVEKTLASTGLVSKLTYFAPADALKEAHTATGGSFHSDGRILVLELAGSSSGKP